MPPLDGEDPNEIPVVGSLRERLERFDQSMEPVRERWSQSVWKAARIDADSPALNVVIENRPLAALVLVLGAGLCAATWHVPNLGAPIFQMISAAAGGFGVVVGLISVLYQIFDRLGVSRRVAEKPILAALIVLAVIGYANYSKVPGWSLGYMSVYLVVNAIIRIALR